MSVADKMPIARRPFISGLLGVIALGGIAAFEAPRLFPRLFAKRYKPTPFDDLLGLLPDRENAVRVGSVLAADSASRDARSIARQLRTQIGGHSLGAVIGADIAQGRLTEAQGWLLPASLADLCLLAALAVRSDVHS